MRVVRAVQIVGIEQVKRSVDLPIQKKRRVFPGVGTPYMADETQRICMLQENPVWSEGSWETGFSRGSGYPDHSPTEEAATISDDSLRRVPTSALNTIREKSPVFSLIWRKTARVELQGGHPDEQCLGTLRATIPAVVLRGRLLTTGARKIFEAKIEGKFLRESLVSHFSVANE